MGDFNFPSINWETENSVNTQERNFIGRISDASLTQIVQEPTRFRSGQRPSLLDLILVSDHDMIQYTEMLPPFGKSDHLSIEVLIKNEHILNETYLKQHDLKKMDFHEFENKMKAIDWNSIFSSKDVDIIYEKISSTANSIVSELAPIRSKTDRSKPPWSNRNVKRLSKKKRKLWDKFKFTRSEVDYENYRNALSEFTFCKDNAVWDYENNIIAKKKCNPKQYYKYVSNRKNYTDDTISLLIDDRIESEPEKCSNIMNDFFTSVFTTDSHLTVEDSGHSDFSLITEPHITEDIVKKKL